MKKLRMLLVSTALMIGGSALATAQPQGYQGWGYQDQDRDHDRDWDRDRDRDGDRDRDRDHDRDWDRDRDRDGYYRTGYRGYANARQFGFQDGFNDGRNDRVGGHSFRPTHDRNYKHADRGFPGGDRNYYKQLYRQSYQDGYQRGYNSAGRWWHW
jgi:hypothetical protein